MTPRNAYSLHAALRMLRHGDEDEENVGIENHGVYAAVVVPPRLRIGAPALVAVCGTRSFGSLNQYRHQLFRCKRRQLLPKHGHVVGQLVGGALDGGRLCEDKGPKFARFGAVGREIQA